MSDLRTGFEIYAKLTKLGLVPDETRSVGKKYTVKKETNFKPWGNEVVFKITKVNAITRPYQIVYLENSKNGIEKLTIYPAPNININKFLSKL